MADSPSPTHRPTPGYPRFHLAFPVTDLDEARRFYGDFLGCAEGRSAPDWVDFDFHGHQIVAHKVDAAQMTDATSLVDGQQVPVRHFGVVLDLPTWEALAERFRSAGVRFIIEPYVRFRGQPGEQATMFFLDPFGNALEFKAFADLDNLFAK
jgi:extradiol dioxygenase family protein